MARHTRRRPTLPFLLLALGVLVVACGGGSSTPSGSAPYEPPSDSYDGGNTVPSPTYGKFAFRVTCGLDERPAGVTVYLYEESSQDLHSWGSSGYEGIYYPIGGVKLDRSYRVELVDRETGACILYLERISQWETPHLFQAGARLDDLHISEEDVAAMPIVHLGGQCSGFSDTSGCWNPR